MRLQFTAPRSPRTSRRPFIFLALTCSAFILSAWSSPASAQSHIVGFKPPATFATIGRPQAIALGDLNGDGKLDAVVANTSADSTTSVVSVLLGDGTGGFGARTDLATAKAPTSVAISDVNGDGKLDLVVATGFSNTVSVLLGNGSGGFSPKVDFAVGTYPTSVALGDVNGDGKLDLVVANFGQYANAGSVTVLLGDGAGGFGSRTDLALASNPNSVAVADLNGDGKLDLVVGGPYAVSIFLSTGAGTFGPRTDLSTTGYVSAVAISDVNGDGRPDLVAAIGSQVATYLGNGTGTFASPVNSYTNTSQIYSMAIADLNGDGRPDIAVVGSNSSGGYVPLEALIGAGDGSFQVQYPQLYSGTALYRIALGDLNGDGHPDIVLGSGNSLMSFVQKAWTASALVASPNASVFGQSVNLTATITPSSATGWVTFYDLGGTYSGSAALHSGTATLSGAVLTAAVHSLVASYAGDSTYGGSISAATADTVRAAGTMVALSSSLNPKLSELSVTFTARVSVAPPGAGAPTGAIQFSIDGSNFGPAVALSGDSAMSASTSTLLPGPHTVQATYSGDTNFISSSAPPLIETVQLSVPEIVGVRDVPNDQGGRVFVTWHFTLDQPGIRIVTGYRVWRRVPSPLPATGPALLAEASPAKATTGPRLRRIYTVLADSSVKETFWEDIADLPAAELVSYGYTAPTTQDSIAGSNPYTAFFIQALTADPFVFYDSAADSGYSVDNLAPRIPGPLTGTFANNTTALHWAENTEPDFKEYRLYRGTSTSFVPSPASLLVARADTGFVDVGSAGGYYKLAAVDVHGNESGAALLSPSDIAGVGGPSLPRTLWLGPVAPNPLANSGSIHLALTREGAVSLVLYDAGGRRIRRLLDGTIPAGVHIVPWDRRDEDGQRVRSGQYFVRLVAEGRTLTTRLVVVP